MEKTCWCLYGEIDLRNVAGMGGRVILAGKSQKQKTIYGGTDYREIY